MNDIFDQFKSFNGSVIGSYDCRESCFLRLYGDADKEKSLAYISELEADGFELLQQRETDGNIFASLKKDIQVNILFTPCDGMLRVTACRENRTPPFAETSCEGDGETVFYGFESDQTLIDCGMCLLIQCPDRSFFIVDSGHYLQMNDNDRIHKFMRERTPEGQKIVVNGWFISHAHTDHISKLIDFLKYNTDDVIIEGFYQNLIRADYETDSDNHEENEMAEKLFRILEEYPAPVYKLHSGMRFHIRNLTFDVLCTHEDIFPAHIDDYNDSSCVITVTVNGSRVFIPGDAAVLSSAVLEARYKEALRSDVVQVSHHGHTGLSASCYSLIGADTAVFPVTRIMFEQDLPRHEANRRVIELASEYHITGDGTVAIPLPYKKGTVSVLPDETFEDFEKIKRLWRYVYSEEYKQELYEKFLANGGDFDALLLPTSPRGWIEPKPPIEE